MRFELDIMAADAPTTRPRHSDRAARSRAVSPRPRGEKLRFPPQQADASRIAIDTRRTSFLPQRLRLRPACSRATAGTGFAPSCDGDAARTDMRLNPFAWPRPRRWQRRREGKREARRLRRRRAARRPPAGLLVVVCCLRRACTGCGIDRCRGDRRSGYGSAARAPTALRSPRPSASGGRTAQRPGVIAVLAAELLGAAGAPCPAAPGAGAAAGPLRC